MVKICSILWKAEKLLHSKIVDLIFLEVLSRVLDVKVGGFSGRGVVFGGACLSHVYNVSPICCSCRSLRATAFDSGPDQTFLLHPQRCPLIRFHSSFEVGLYHCHSNTPHPSIPRTLWSTPVPDIKKQGDIDPQWVEPTYGSVLLKCDGNVRQGRTKFKYTGEPPQHLLIVDRRFVPAFNNMAQGLLTVG